MKKVTLSPPMGMRKQYFTVFMNYLRGENVPLFRGRGGKYVCVNPGKSKMGRRWQRHWDVWLAGSKVRCGALVTVACSRRGLIKGGCSEDGLLSCSGVATGTFSETRGCNGLSSEVFVTCMSRDAWDWRHCSCIVQLWLCWPLLQGPIKPLVWAPVVFFSLYGPQKRHQRPERCAFRFVWCLILNTWFPGPNFGTFKLFCSA